MAESPGGADALRIEVPSPCRDICRLDDAGVCIGCGRLAQEIAEWPRAGGARRLAIRAAARLRIEQQWTRDEPP